MTRQLRSYEGAWLQLREKKVITLAAPAQAHYTIIHMLRKEKKMDAEYKFLLAEANLRSKLEHKVDGSKITFRLVETLTVFGI
jgi:hypothetical protein